MKYTLLLLLIPKLLFSNTVTQIKASYQSGQVFLTWKNLKATNLQYNIYRSTTRFTSDSQLTNNLLLGFVRDSSGKNIRKSKLQNQDFYFVTDPASGPLSSKTGLYVITCTNNKKHFYAITVTDLSTGIEDKTIITGENSSLKGISESKATPQPVLQATVTKPNGDVNYEYVIWGNNQDVPGYPAFNNCGSYGYNFTLVNRDAGTIAPLFIKFEDEDPFAQVESSECMNCNILQLDDWLPNGYNTYWAGFNTHYDMYSNINPVQTSGTVRTYTVNRNKQIINWAKAQPIVQSTKVYASGFSHNGFGAMFTSILLPDAFAATAETSAPTIIKALPGTDRESQWCSYYTDVSSDILNPVTGDTLLIWNIFDLPTMYNLNINKTLPYMSGVNGKQDVTVGWVQYYHYYDSVDINRQGGVWFWDQRNHGGAGKDFSVTETHLPFLRFSTDKSYPAFSYCSINGNPGDGDTSSGDPYGTLNGYLDWNNSIIDKSCEYSITCFVKDLYAGGVLQKPYDSCTTDITLRRLQKFKPMDGDVITWKVKNSNGNIVQTGAFTYSSSAPITLSAIKIYKSGSTILFSITNCNKEEDVLGNSPGMKLMRTDDGYHVSLERKEAGNVWVSVTDLLGRIVSRKLVILEAGNNTFEVPMNGGIYILTVKATDFSESQEVFFAK